MNKWYAVYTVGDMLQEAGKKVNDGNEVIVMIEIALIAILAMVLQWILGWLGLGKWAKYVYITGGLMAAKLVMTEVLEFLKEVTSVFG